MIMSTFLLVKSNIKERFNLCVTFRWGNFLMNYLGLSWQCFQSKWLMSQWKLWKAATQDSQFRIKPQPQLSSSCYRLEEGINIVHSRGLSPLCPFCGLLPPQPSVPHPLLSPSPLPGWEEGSSWSPPHRNSLPTEQCFLLWKHSCSCGALWLSTSWEREPWFITKQAGKPTWSLVFRCHPLR